MGQLQCPGPLDRELWGISSIALRLVSWSQRTCCCIIVLLSLDIVARPCFRCASANDFLSLEILSPLDLHMFNMISLLSRLIYVHTSNWHPFARAGSGNATLAACIPRELGRAGEIHVHCWQMMTASDFSVLMSLTQEVVQNDYATACRAPKQLAASSLIMSKPVRWRGSSEVYNQWTNANTFQWSRESSVNLNFHVRSIALGNLGHIKNPIESTNVRTT